MPQIDQYYVLERTGKEVDRLLGLVSSLTTDGTTITMVGHSPQIGTNGHWEVWDETTQRYVDTGIPADLSQEVKDKIEYSYEQALEAASANTNQILVADGSGKWNWVDFNNTYASKFIEEDNWNSIKSEVYN